MALVDKFGSLVRFTLIPGNAYEGGQVDPLIKGIPTEELIADRGFDSNRIRLQLLSAGIEPVIPGRRNRKVQPWYDPDRYSERHLVENFFAKIKQFRRIATRYEKTAACFAGMVYLAAAYLATKGTSKSRQSPPRAGGPPKDGYGSQLVDLLRMGLYPPPTLPAQPSLLACRRE